MIPIEGESPIFSLFCLAAVKAEEAQKLNERKKDAKEGKGEKREDKDSPNRSRPIGSFLTDWFEWWTGMSYTDLVFISWVVMTL